MSEKPNVILITVDSLRADHLSCYGYPRPTSPHIDQLAEEGYLFTNAFANGPNTPHAFPAIMASRYPFMSNRLGLFDAQTTLAELLQSFGYQTFGFNAANPYISRFFQYDRGFDRFDDFIDFASIAGDDPTRQSRGNDSILHKSLDGIAKIAKAIIPAETNIYNYLEHWKVFLKSYATIHLSLENKRILLDQFYAKIGAVLESEITQPFFLWIHGMDSHYPYTPRKRFMTELDLDIVDRSDVKKIATNVKHDFGLDDYLFKKTLDLYDGTIRELDSQIARIMDVLRKKNIYQNSLIVFTADHGEEFLEHKGLKHTSKLFDELLHVPLIIKIPQNKNGKKIKRLLSHLDLLPTICEVLNLPYNLDAFQGNSFHEGLETILSNEHHYVISEATSAGNAVMPSDDDGIFDLQKLPKIYSLRTANWKLIRDLKKGPTHLFNLKDDPNEQVNLVNRERDLSARLDSLLQIHIDREQRTLLKSQISSVKRSL